MADKSAKQNKQFGSRARIKAVQKIPCLVCGATPSENAHVISRGAGGIKTDIVPLCNEHHADLHVMGRWTFQKKYDINLLDEADALADHLKIYETGENE